ncbi:Ribonuclease T2-like 1-A [Candida viswanathii]|uniref:ribonuclease T2 n=1 Tax=Candida viswanathii TaxID=5486 RepID=A0A367YGQ2_9ASCO|nr:Ribonuclease T2-like 1-A [Candida viswanathii]
MRYILLLLALFITKVYSDDLTNSCPVDSPLSCSTSGDTSNSCCYESPAGVIELTQFWDYDPVTGPSDIFTMHGLWSMYCTGTSYPQSCDSSLEVTSSGSTLQDIIVNQFNDQELYDNLSKYWKDINGNDHLFWAHEWNKHGTCFSTIKPSCYTDYKTNENVYDFIKVLYNLWSQVPTYQWLSDAGITPSTTATYTKDQIQNALKGKFGKNVYFKCDSNNAINEVWYYYNVKGSLLGEGFVPIDAVSSSNCPSSGIKFPPKGSSSSGGTTLKTSTTSTSGSTPTGVPSSAYIKLSGMSGCLISGGTYYTSGTCATYRFSGSEDSVTLTSSKGSCGFDSSANFVCSSSTTAGSFQISGGQVGYNGNFDWCLGDVASGSGSTTQTYVKLSDGSCDSFKLTLSS